jgi:hypothetical protein
VLVDILVVVEIEVVVTEVEVVVTEVEVEVVVVNAPYFQPTEVET